jgi:hypothetical protein
VTSLLTAVRPAACDGAPVTSLLPVVRPAAVAGASQTSHGSRFAVTAGESFASQSADCSAADRLDLRIAAESGSAENLLSVGFTADGWDVSVAMVDGTPFTLPPLSLPWVTGLLAAWSVAGRPELGGAVVRARL